MSIPFSVTGEREDGYNVWLQLEAGDPLTQANSFIVGWGPTKVQALAHAAHRLQFTSMDLLQAAREESLK